MPAPKRAGKPVRTKTRGTDVVALALDMEEPLNEALGAVHALRLIGQELLRYANEKDAHAIEAVAWTACHRLGTLQQTWRSLLKVAARGRMEGALPRV